MEGRRSTDNKELNLLKFGRPPIEDRVIDDPLAEILGELEDIDEVLDIPTTHDLLMEMTKDRERDPLSDLTLLREIFERKRYYLNEIDLHID